MTVSVTRTDGSVDNYMRSGDAYVKAADGSLDIVRTGSKKPFSYGADQWSEVHGDQRRTKRRFLPW
ncbi:hypothetical protein [[Mycobacterium] wendilense]|uniref:Uncharacterized protein n=1 Tax=[Mycobacterium] wendilense TaxID=3064284 RepID=A0ABM9MDF6_9MYCO|nr:hypothetical protein [Mycolicibacterium sp. MU0050]CAJ1582523.1 hypothetical protein MU0050_002141 [Mycolicibacterium sp. MU0050]